MEDVTLQGVQEYAEQMEVCLGTTKGIYNPELELDSNIAEGYGRLVIKAWNEGGWNRTEVDLLQLLHWLHKNRPDLIEMAKKPEEQ